MYKPSEKRILSSGLVAEIEHCAGCEVMHLHIGAFSLRMKPAAMHDLCDTLKRALASLPGPDCAATVLQNADPVSGGSCH